MKEYPRTLDAVQRYEGGAWAVADALLEEVEVDGSGRARHGEIQTAQKYLASQGFDVDAGWLGHLRAAAQFVAGVTDLVLKNELRSYSARSVYAVSTKAKGDPERARDILVQHGGKLHAIEGTNAVGDVSKLSDQQAGKLQADLLKKQPVAAQRVIAREATPHQLDGIVRDLPEDKQRHVRNVADRELIDNAFPKRREAERKTRDARNARHSLRYLEADKELDKARAAIRQVLTLSREVEFVPEEIELLLHDVNDLRSLLGLIELALQGSSEVDWDSELAKITD